MNKDINKTKKKNKKLNTGCQTVLVIEVKVFGFILFILSSICIINLFSTVVLYEFHMIYGSVVGFIVF